MFELAGGWFPLSIKMPIQSARPEASVTSSSTKIFPAAEASDGRSEMASQRHKSYVNVSWGCALPQMLPALVAQRQSTVRTLLTVAKSVTAVARPEDIARAHDLRDHIARFAEAEKMVRHWPLDGPATDDQFNLLGVAKILEDEIRNRVQPALTSYHQRNLSFDALEMTIRGLIDC